MDPGRIAFGLRGIATELKERLLAVPVYQRSYAWTTDEIGEYWADLRGAFSDNVPELCLLFIHPRRPEPDRSPICRDYACMISSFVRARPWARPQTQTLSC